MLDIIKSSADITRVFKQGTRFGRGSNTLIVLKKEQHGQAGRVAFVAGKKQGNAVWRNRAKRRMRAAYQQLGGPWPDYDIVFVAGRRTVDIDFERMVREYRRSLRESGVCIVDDGGNRKACDER